jgi:hypothetical protein
MLVIVVIASTQRANARLCQPAVCCEYCPDKPRGCVNDHENGWVNDHENGVHNSENPWVKDPKNQLWRETTLTCALGKWSEDRGNQCVRFASDADWVV